MRLIDRPIRPLFAKGLLDEVVVQCWVESADEQNDPDVLAGCAAAAALQISSLPFEGPVATVRVGRVEDQYVINPTTAQLEYSDMELVLSGHREGVNMIEVGAMEVAEDAVLGAIKFGHEQMMPILDMVDELVAKAGKEKHADLHLPPQELLDQVIKDLEGPLTEAKQTDGKLAREEAVQKVFDDYLEAQAPLPGENDDVSYTRYQAIVEKRRQIKATYETLEEKVTRKIIMSGHRTDGRKADEIRPLTCEVGVLKRTHGSAVFTRGETQAMVSCTLGVGKDEQIVDGLQPEYSQKFMLHYNFPPFCVGEARRITGPSRREIGHGALAERSLAGIMPDVEKFPYTVRLISEILESNGSSSMASVCGGCLALMDAGVPIAATCAGISIGLILEDGADPLLLTDILGEEDHFGDMDFKVAGTRNGVTGIQLDLKTRGLDYDLIEKTFQRAREARMQVIEMIESVIDSPRGDISEYAPRLVQLKINPEKIGALIGPGGKIIRSIQEKTNTNIEVDDDGTVVISGVGSEAVGAARSEVEKLTEEVRLGSVYDGKVSSVKDFGAFIEVIPGQDGLCHISELDSGYVEKVSDVVKVGDPVRVKVINIDEQGRLKLSRKAVLKEESTDQKG
jgi:polyribonucleotide nucleotidyltransferase